MAVSIIVVLALLFLAVVNPLLLLVAVVGTMLGIAVRLLLEARRFRPEHPEPDIDGRATGQSPTVDHPKPNRRLIWAVVVGAIAIMATFSLLGGPQFRACARDESHSILYQGNALAEPSMQRWDIEDELLVAADVLDKKDVEASRSELVSRLADLGWFFADEIDTKLRFTRSRVAALSNDMFPLSQDSEIALPELAWGTCLEGRTVLVPGENSILALTAPEYVVLRTFPKSEGEDKLNEMTQWRVPSEFTLTDNGVVRIETSSRLARNNLTASLANLSTSQGLLWLVGIVFALFGKYVEEALGQPIRRLFVWLRLLKPKKVE